MSAHEDAYSMLLYLLWPGTLADTQNYVGLPVRERTSVEL